MATDCESSAKSLASYRRLILHIAASGRDITHNLNDYRNYLRRHEAVCGAFEPESDNPIMEAIAEARAAAVDTSGQPLAQSLTVAMTRRDWVDIQNQLLMAADYQRQNLNFSDAERCRVLANVIADVLYKGNGR
jgi:hypothetical protein